VGFEPSNVRPAQYAAQMQQELKTYTEAAQQTGLKPQ
jgi:hypothetical protein